MYRHIHLTFCLLALLFLGVSHSLIAQCDQMLAFESETPSVVIQQAFAADNAGYSYDMEIKSPKGGKFTFKGLTLKEAYSRGKIAGAGITFSIPGDSLKPDQLSELSIKIPKVATAGNYEGSFFIYYTAKGDTSGKPTCQWEIPLAVRLYEAGKLTVKDAGTEIAVNTVPTSFPNNLFNFILPTKIKGNSFSVNVKNEGTIPVEVEDYSIEIKGAGNNQYLSKENLIMQKPEEGLIIEPGRTEIITFTFANKPVDVDSYGGDVYLHLANRNDLLTAKVKINRRMGVFWALLALVLGILAGRMLRDVNSESGKLQIELMKELAPLELRVDSIEDEVARRRLLGQLNALETKINDVSTAEEQGAVKNDLPAMSNRITQLVKWEEMWREVNVKMLEANLYEDDEDAIAIMAEINGIRDSLLNDEAEQATTKVGKLDTLLKKIAPDPVKSKDVIQGTGEKGSDEQTPPEQVPDVMLSMEKFKESLDSKPTKKVAQGDTQKAGRWKWLLKITTFFDRFRASARVRYTVFRPIAILMAFTVLLLLGFQEIYVNGTNSGTFGADGIYDAMKLFLWGVVSDVFSRNILGSFTSNEKVTSFAGNNG